MLTLRNGLAVCSAVLIVAWSGMAAGQAYPNKPVRIFSSEPGGSSDSAARLVAQGLTGLLGQQMVVDSRPAIIAIETVGKAPPDGYSVLVMSNLLWILPLMQSTTYDAVKDFQPVSLVASSPNILVVHPSLPVKSVKELVALAKSKPGQLNYGTSGTGASNHLAAELFKSMAGVDIVRVNYKGGGPGMVALVGGEVQLFFAGAASVTGHIKSGRLRALGVTSAQPSALSPGLPPIAVTVPGYETVAAYGMFAPAATPAAIVNRLNQEIARYLSTAEAKERFLNTGSEAMPNSPEQFATMIKAEIVGMGKIIKEAGIR